MTNPMGDAEKENGEVRWTPEGVEEIFGFPIHALYKHSIKFYKEKEKSGELQLEYATRLQFMAYFKQAKYGSFKEEIADCGWFDLVGNDTRNEWKKLGSLSVEQAMVEFVRLLDIVCPAFRPHIKACRELEAPKVVLGEAQVNKLGNLADETSVDSQEVLLRYQQQSFRKQIQEALNKQTYHQFLAYAQQTHPGEPTKQEELIKQLQEQHYEQYMSQVYAQQSQAQVASMLENTSISAKPGDAANMSLSESTNSSSSSGSGGPLSTDDSEAGPKPADAYLQQGLERPKPRHKVKVINDEGGISNANGASSDISDDEEAAPDDAPSNPRIAPASLGNRDDIQEFKDSIRKEGSEGILKIGHGETVTVRVPTHEEGVCLSWEFATDYYDLGFGVYFEWTIADSNQVTVHVSESSDEDYDEDELAGEGGAPPPGSDVAAAEAGANQSANRGGYRRSRKHDPNKPPIDEIIPIFRRDCHEQVFTGCHVYPGRGVYLLKFDNTYSLWRSKTLYYRVFYSR